MKSVDVKYLTDYPEVSADTPNIPYEIRQIRENLQKHRTPLFPTNDLVERVGGNFIVVGLENLYNTIITCNLRPQSRVLEVGCGCGRNARYIAPLLNPLSGCFMGFDIDEEMIIWCQEHITSLFPNTRFDYADIHHKTYNPKGSLNVDKYAFPYLDKSFDIVVIPSVFTHMTKVGFEHYLSEIHRVLKPHGRFLSWHFLTTQKTIDTKQGKESSRSVRYDDVSWVKTLIEPSDFIVYETDYVLESLRSAGFTVHVKMTGQWDGQIPTGSLSYQDRILSTKNP